MQEKRYDSVLGWGSPFDLVCKLEREKRRIQSAKMLDEFVEHTMNFALTAFHMTDWVWTVLERGLTEPERQWEREKWISAIGFDAKKRSEVVAWAKSQCPELEYCRQLANASKHLACKLKPDAPVTEFAVAPTEDWKRRQREDPFMSMLDDHLAEHWRLVLVDHGKDVDLVEVLLGPVFRFWSDICYTIYIGDA